MAVNALAEKVTLKIEFDGGLVDGKQIVKSKSFNKVKTEAPNEDLHGTARTMAGLQDKDLLAVKKVETSEIVEA